MRPFSSLGYSELHPDHPEDAMRVAGLDVVLDTHRLSKYAPTGMSMRHHGFHLARDPARPGVVSAILVTKPQADQFVRVWIEEFPTVAEGLAWFNDQAYSVHGDYAPVWRPNPLDATQERWDRALAEHPVNPRGLTVDERRLDRQLDDAAQRFLGVYERYGGWRFHGRPDATDPAGYAGPLFWQEEDVRFRLGLELEREFPGSVHLNSLLSPATVPGWDPEEDGKH